MEQITVNEDQDYEVLKMELKATLDETADNFVVIGYILKQVRDRRLYLHENYSDIYGFGQGEYGLSRATVSRFMNINTRFSVGGNSREMKPEYKGYGRSKIQEMLNVDEGDMELITADTTVEQVKELKKAEEQQRQIEKEEQENNLPLVLMAAGQEENESPVPEPMEPFDAVMTAFWKENMDLYCKVTAGMLTPEIVAEEISPSGSRTFREGVNIMFFYDIDKGLKLRSYAKGKADITSYTYQELIDRTTNLNLTENLPQETVAAPQLKTESDEQSAYIPLPGQTSVADLQNVMPDTDNETAAAPKENRAPEEVTEKVIDGEYRELDDKPVQEKEGKKYVYSDIEIKHAINYFELEYYRMVGLGQDTAKRRDYRIALECICRCYKTIAKQTDMMSAGLGV